ncbi:MAG: Glutamate-tRNA ligase [Candidatus Saccharibacteria bacterium GW2011_GWC2_48_9]|nr:MAG: Glutamate-tRNA ligase [Candidatus Saccharibacteria bacterium GW2011_GWC2_48_9]
MLSGILIYMKHIRTRFAPSPTGFLHVGGVRTALFAWLLARQSNGQFILRIEDTDKAREVEGSAAHIIKCLSALGVDYDEGPNKTGEYGPYLQSERLEIYRTWAQKLIDSGRAYADPYTSEQLQAFRDEARANKRAFLYRNHRPENPPTWEAGMPLRFKSDPKAYAWHDEVMGDLSTGPEVVDDIILIKSDGYPTYNFAHIVDDAEMQITHVIRGQEFISSQPTYLNLYEALEVERPIFATMPHILAETGGKKLSKRDGAKDILDYIADGYTPEALINFIASLGWNDGTEQEVFTREELVAKFSLDRVQRSGARFDARRLLWMNGQHIRMLPLDELEQRVENFWPASAQDASEARKRQILSLVQDRLKTLTDLPILSSYFFEEPDPNWTMLQDNKQLKKLEQSESQQMLTAARETFTTIPDDNFQSDTIQNTLNSLLESTGQKPAVLFSLIRLSVSWAPFSPALPDTLAALGKDTVIARIDRSLGALSE